jgi:CheY-like chemotaxis protein
MPAPEEAFATLLIATADSALGTLLSAQAESAGAHVLWEADGMAAYEAVLEHQPQAVMLDVNLPIHTGLELAEMLRADPEVPRELRIALLTDDAVEPHRLERAGVDGIFPKTHDAAMFWEWLGWAVHHR